MRSFHFDNEKKELKEQMAHRIISAFLDGLVCALNIALMIESFKEGDSISGLICLIPIVLWGSLAVLEVSFMKKNIELSIDFLRDMFKINELYRKQDIELLENEIEALRDELGKAKNTEL